MSYAKCVLLVLALACALVYSLSPKKRIEPPPNLPPVVYLVSQFTEGGDLMMTDSATEFTYSYQGRCISYVHADDPPNAYSRIICGGLIRVQPKSR